LKSISLAEDTRSAEMSQQTDCEVTEQLTKSIRSIWGGDVCQTNMRKHPRYDIYLNVWNIHHL